MGHLASDHITAARAVCSFGQLHGQEVIDVALRPSGMQAAWIGLAADLLAWEVLIAREASTYERQAAWRAQCAHALLEAGNTAIYTSGHPWASGLEWVRPESGIYLCRAADKGKHSTCCLKAICGPSITRNAKARCGIAFMAFVFFHAYRIRHQNMALSRFIHCDICVGDSTALDSINPSRSKHRSSGSLQRQDLVSHSVFRYHNHSAGRRTRAVRRDGRDCVETPSSR